MCPGLWKCEDGIPKALLRRAGKGKYRMKYSGERKVHIRNIQSAVRSTSGRPAERRSVTGYKCAHSGISGSKEGRAVFKFAEGLRKTVVRTADGRTSDDCICAADQLLDEKNTRSRSNCKENKDCNWGKTEYNKCK